MADPRYASALAEALAEDALERFQHYVVVDTQASYSSTTYPSTLKQLDLSKILEAELRKIGLEDVSLTEHGYVLATLPGTVPGAPTVGLIAHVDTSPDAPGANVKPLVHREWDGKPITLPGDPTQILDPARNAALAAHVGNECQALPSRGAAFLRHTLDVAPARRLLIVRVAVLRPARAGEHDVRACRRK